MSYTLTPADRARIAETVAAFPRLSPAQVDRLSTLLAVTHVG